MNIHTGKQPNPHFQGYIVYDDATDDHLVTNVLTRPLMMSLQGDAEQFLDENTTIHIRTKTTSTLKGLSNAWLTQHVSADVFIDNKPVGETVTCKLVTSSNFSLFEAAKNLFKLSRFTKKAYGEALRAEDKIKQEQIEEDEPVILKFPRKRAM